jgi:sec-independent protein translocase protein TatB
MLDFSFSELMVIAVVALVVIGPERLPKVARTMGILLGRMQRYVNDVKADIGREMELEELRKLQGEVHEAARSIESTVSSIESTVHKEISDTGQALNQTIAPALDAIRGTETAPPAVTPALPEPAAPEPAMPESATPPVGDAAAPYGIGHAAVSDGKPAEAAATPPKS